MGRGRGSWGDAIVAAMRARKDPRVDQLAAAPKRRAVKRARPPVESLGPPSLPWRFVIDGAPRTKNTGKLTKGGQIIPSKPYREWFHAAMAQVQRIRAAGIVGIASKPVIVTAHWYRNRDTGDEDRFKVALGDFLERAGFIFNDRLIHWGGGCERRIDRARPRTEILIESGDVL